MSEYKIRIAHLEQGKAALKNQLDEAMAVNAPDHVIQEIKKRKLQIKDLIEDLRRKDLDHQGKEFK